MISIDVEWRSSGSFHDTICLPGVPRVGDKIRSLWHQGPFKVTEVMWESDRFNEGSVTIRVELVKG